MKNAMFLAHGSPVTAFTRNSYTEKWEELAKALPRPDYIVVVSAHWVTHGTFITSSEQPETIHDFYGFPEHFYQYKYPARGAPELAKHMSNVLPLLQEDVSRGLDHGNWALLKHLYPMGDIPVLQISIDAGAPLTQHIDIAEKIWQALPEQTLLICSGNIVHNLKRMSRKEEDAKACWAVTFEQEVKQALLRKDKKRVCQLPLDIKTGGPESVPTLEHYIPLLYLWPSLQSASALSFPIEGIVFHSISMLSVFVV